MEHKKQFITMLTRIERVASIAGQKSAVIKENAKYSFVELGKFNTSVYTRRISVCPVHIGSDLLISPVLSRVSDKSSEALGWGLGGGFRFYTIIERVQSESRGKSPGKK